MTATREPLGALLAGGASRRFGSPKALATVGGLTLAERARDALRGAVGEVVLIASDPAPLRFIGLPTRPDLRPGGGPLSGLHAALRWAEELHRPGALCLACDLPLLTPALLRHLVSRARATGAWAAAPLAADLLPQPLCAYYSVSALPEVEERLARGALAMRGLLEALGAEMVGLDEIRELGDPEILFLNVNTPDDAERAESLVGIPQPIR